MTISAHDLDSFFRLPFGDGLPADPQLFRHLLLGQAAVFPGVEQAVS